MHLSIAAQKWAQHKKVPIFLGPTHAAMLVRELLFQGVSKETAPGIAIMIQVEHHLKNIQEYKEQDNGKSEQFSARPLPPEVRLE